MNGESLLSKYDRTQQQSMILRVQVPPREVSM